MERKKMMERERNFHCFHFHLNTLEICLKSFHRRRKFLKQLRIQLFSYFEKPNEDAKILITVFVTGLEPI